MYIWIVQTDGDLLPKIYKNYVFYFMHKNWRIQSVVQQINVDQYVEVVIC